MNKQGEGRIDWTDWTWNPQSGCLHHCSYCYMRRMRMYDMTPKYHPERLLEPDKKKKPAKIFVGSSGDMFGKWVPGANIKLILDLCKSCQQHTFQFLTKNPRRYHDFEFGKNCWLGTTVDSAVHASRLIHLSMRGHKPVMFCSFEPLLTPMDDVSLIGLNWIIIGANSNRVAELPPKKWIDDLIKRARQKHIAVWVKDNCYYPERIKEFPN